MVNLPDPKPDSEPDNQPPATEPDSGDSSAVQAARRRLEREREREQQLSDRNISSSSAQKALESAQENLRLTLQSDAQDQAAGRGYYSERSRRERNRDDDPGRYTEPDSGDSSAVQAARRRLEREREREQQLSDRNTSSSAAQKALERAEDNLRLTLQSDAQDQAAGRGYYSERSRRERDRDDDPGRYTDVDDGEHENEDGSTTFVSTDSNANTHVRVYAIDETNGGEYLAETRVIRADGSVTIREHDRFGNEVVGRRDYGPGATEAQEFWTEIYTMAKEFHIPTEGRNREAVFEAVKAELDHLHQVYETQVHRLAGERDVPSRGRAVEDIAHDVNLDLAKELGLDLTGKSREEVSTAVNNRLDADAQRFESTGEAWDPDTGQYRRTYRDLDGELYFRPDGGETYDHRPQATDRPLFAYDPDQDGPVDPNTQIFDVTTRGEARAREAAGLALVLPEDPEGPSSFEAARAWEVGASGRLHSGQVPLFKAAKDLNIDVDNFDGSMDDLYQEVLRRQAADRHSGQVPLFKAAKDVNIDVDNFDGSMDDLYQEVLRRQAADRHSGQVPLFKAAKDVNIDVDNFDGSMDDLYQEVLRRQTADRHSGQVPLFKAAKDVNIDVDNFDGSMDDLYQEVLRRQTASVHDSQAQFFKAAKAVGFDVDSWTGTEEEMFQEIARRVDAYNASETASYEAQLAAIDEGAGFNPGPGELVDDEIARDLARRIQRDLARRIQAGVDQGPVVLDDLAPQTMVLDPSLPFDRGTFTEAMHAADAAGDDGAKQQLVRYYESYGQLFTPDQGSYFSRKPTLADELKTAALIGGLPYAAAAASVGTPLAATWAAANPLAVAQALGLSKAGLLQYGIGGSLSAGIATSLPADGEGWFEYTGGDIPRGMSAAGEAALMLRGTNLLLQGGRVSLAGAPSLYQRAPWLANTFRGRALSNLAAGGAFDAGYLSLPVGGDRSWGLSQADLISMGLGAGFSVGSDAAIAGFRAAGGPVGAVLQRQVPQAAIATDKPLRFPAELFATDKPLAQRTAEAQAYVDNWLAQVKQSNPAHYQALLQTTGGRTPTLEDFRLNEALRHNVDVVEMLRARDVLSRGGLTAEGAAYPIPGSDLALELRPTPFMRQRPPGSGVHATQDITPLAQTPLIGRLPGKGPANLGVFSAPGYAVGDVLRGSYDPRFRRFGEDLRPGFIEQDLSQAIVTPKVSLQPTPGFVALDTVLDLPRQGAILPAELTAPAGKRHRASVVVKDPQGRILLVKGKGDPLWGLPGGGVDPGETALTAGAREVAEETGYAASGVRESFDYDSPTTYHSVFEARVANPDAAAELQAKEIEDVLWWDGQALDMMPSTRDILEQSIGYRPDLRPARPNLEIPWGRVQDWRQRVNPTGEIELVRPVGTLQRPLDVAQSVPLQGYGNIGARYYIEEGAPPITRGQITRSVIELLRQRLRLSPSSGLQVRNTRTGELQDIDAWVDSQRVGLQARVQQGDIEGRETLRRLNELDVLQEATFSRGRGQGLEVRGGDPSGPRAGRDGALARSPAPALRVELPSVAGERTSRFDEASPRSADTAVARATAAREQGSFRAELPPPGEGVVPRAELPPPGEGVVPRAELPPPGEGVVPRAELPPPGEGVVPRVELPPPGEGVVPRVELPPPGEGVVPRVELPPPGEGVVPRVELPPPGEGVVPRVELPPRLEPPRLRPPWPRLEPPRLRPPWPRLEPPPRIKPPPPESPPGRRRIRRPGDEEKEAAGTQQGGAHPRSVTFETHEQVRLHLPTGQTRRTPIGNRPAETLEVTEFGPEQQVDQHHVGRITDVKTDGAGRPFVVQRPEHQHVRPQGEGAAPAESWPENPPKYWAKGRPWPPNSAIAAELARELLAQQSQTRQSTTPARGSSRNKNTVTASKVVKPFVNKKRKGNGDLMNRVGGRRHGWL